MTNKYAIFDIGNILVSVDFYKFINKLHNSKCLIPEKTLSVLEEAHIKHDLGQTDINDIFKDIYLYQQESFEELIDLWNDIITPESTMIDLLNRLSNDGIKIALLSNIGFEHCEHLSNMWENEPFYLNGIQWFSCEQGLRKPNIEYYQKFLEIHPEFAGCYYFDDLQANLDMGTQIGFKSIKFDLNDYFPSLVPNSSTKEESLSRYIRYSSRRMRPQTQPKQFEKMVLKIEKMIMGENDGN